MRCWHKDMGTNQYEKKAIGFFRKSLEKCEHRYKENIRVRISNPHRIIKAIQGILLEEIQPAGLK